MSVKIFLSDNHGCSNPDCLGSSILPNGSLVISLNEQDIFCFQCALENDIIPYAVFTIRQSIKENIIKNGIIDSDKCKYISISKRMMYDLEEDNFVIHYITGVNADTIIQLLDDNALNMHFKNYVNIHSKTFWSLDMGISYFEALTEKWSPARPLTLEQYNKLVDGNLI